MSEIWKRGSMTFTDKWAKPPKMSMDEFVKSDDGRTWVSKDGELPSDFFARILSDMPEAVSNELIKALLLKKMFNKTPKEIQAEIERLEARYL